MATVFTLFGMNVVHDQAKDCVSKSQPTTYQEYIEFLKHQLHSPSAVTPSLPAKEDVRIQCQVRARIPTNEGGEMFLYLYKNNQDTKEHLAIVYGDDLRSRSLDRGWENETIVNRIVRGAYYGRLEEVITEECRTMYLSEDQMKYLEKQQEQAKRAYKPSNEPPLVRIHSECFTGETVHSARCDCGEQLDEAMRLMQKAGRGVIVYLRQEGRGIGLLEKLKAYNLQDLGHDTVAANVLLNHPPDGRTYGLANAILEDLQLSKIRLLTNNPDKIQQIESYGSIKVVERREMVPRSWSSTPSISLDHDTNITDSPNIVAALHKLQRTPTSSPAVPGSPKKELDKYLAVKVKKMGHILNLPEGLS
ncbi:GTP cyclohydrolase II-domain-containing protein [Radiomyces spectabilis]|uniref:GTP cyclohydrolase II-domain-containing protein n=1 Tax=Radiomyces spectabilis TaxID=64574 RepID=UPI00222015CD|nr:GTP cyclohydrolase II-domain-containing protein [Radiomyces spectabilis]KAI8391529.1 GTP cyclohydrolase II-domain-containing protein [Radiomyces spectabilis]